MKSPLLLLVLAAPLLAPPAFAAGQKTDIAAPTAGGASVETNTSMSDAEATRRLQSHHIRETHRVTIGSTDPAGPGDGGKPRPDGAAQGAPSAGGAGGAAGGYGASSPPGGGAASSLAGKLQDGPVTEGALNDQAKVMLGGTPMDFRSQKAKVQAAVGQAANAWMLGDLKTVIAQTNQALLADPGNKDALSMQALAYERMKDFADSEADLRRVVAVDSSDAKNWEHLAWASYKQNKAQDALAAAQAALALDAGDPAALAIKAYAEDALGQRAQAAADIKAAAQLDPSFASRAARADSQDRLCAPEEDLADAGGGRRAKAGLPSWAPWIGGSMLVGLGLMLALVNMLKAPPAPAPAEESAARPPAQPPAA